MKEDETVKLLLLRSVTERRDRKLDDTSFLVHHTRCYCSSSPTSAAPVSLWYVEQVSSGREGGGDRECPYQNVLYADIVGIIPFSVAGWLKSSFEIQWKAAEGQNMLFSCDFYALALKTM